MGNKKNIDRLFQEKFKDFEAFPERDMWAGIEARLDGIPSGSRKKPAAFWWRLGGIAATIALLLSVGLNFLFTEPDNIHPGDPLEKVVERQREPAGGEALQNEGQQQQPEDTGPGEKEIQTVTPSQPVRLHESRSAGTDNAAQQEGSHETQQQSGLTSRQEKGFAAQQQDNLKKAVADHTDRQSAKTGIPVAGTPSENKKEGDIGIADKKNQVAQHNEKESKTTDPPRPVESHKRTTQQENDRQQQESGLQNESGEGPRKSLEEAIAEMEREKEKELALKQGKESGKWSVNPNIAPVYYNSLGGGSPIDPEFKDNSRSGKVNLSYGVNVAYQVSNRVSLRSGINRVNYGYNTNDISFAPDFEARALSNINYTQRSGKASGLYVANANDSPPVSAREEVASSFLPQEGHMQQELGYIEVPMEMKYRVVNTKLGLNLIGGVSSLFLTDNSVLLKSNTLATELGEANNVNNVNFSTNVGLGVDYLLSDKLQLQVEPMFKYQWNTFSNDDGGFRPYSFGVYTGFSFRF